MESAFYFYQDKACYLTPYNAAVINRHGFFDVKLNQSRQFNIILVLSSLYS